MIGKFASVSNPSEDMTTRMNTLRMEFQRVLNIIETIVPNNRERSLAITKLEEASMWANKSITREVNHEQK